MSTYREKLQNLLRELFQFDSADLDFGFYAVMNQKRDVIEQFITQDLPVLISEGLEAVATQNRAEVEANFERARQTVIDSLGESAFDGETLQTHFAGTPAGKAYLVEKEKLDKLFVPEDVEARIYNDLFTFFARYYQDGDFISQRRYGASDKYAVPYNGEEVHLHWANFDQYYVKTGVHFQNYSFVVPGGIGIGNTNVQVRLTKVDVPRDNVKGEKRFFVYSDDLPIEWDGESQTLVIPMEYRPLTPEESGFTERRNQQEKLLEAAYDGILAAIPNKTLKARLREVDPTKKTEKDRLMYHLNRYAAENTRDFFVHKDLGGFLGREFDYYLKAEVLRLEDIDFSDTIFAERKAAQLKTTRQIGEAIIRFVDQLERFQKQLFLKRKFVLQHDYCLTLDKIPAEIRADFYPEILANERQLAEWKKLYGVIVTTESNLDFQPHLMLDTVFYNSNFKFRLLACFNDIDEAVDGLLIQGENYQANRILANRFHEQIKCIYIDPPYNRKEDDFIYKDAFKHSSWMTLFENRIDLAKDLLSVDGVLYVSIDDNELPDLLLILEKTWGKENHLATLARRTKSGGGSAALHFAVEHDYVIAWAKEKNSVSQLYVPYDPEYEKRYSEEDDIGRYYWDTLERSSTGTKPYKIEAPDGTLLKGSWFKSEDTYKAELKRGDIQFVAKSDGGWSVQFKQRIGLGKKIRSLLAENKFKSDQRDLDPYGLGGVFSYQKPVYLIYHLVQAATANNNYVLDYFAGSGTTAHAVMKLNSEEKKNLKYLLVEMGECFDTVLKPRIQKVAYSNKWKDGKPLLPENGQTALLSNGQSHMFQYLRLESYDDTFHNIRFREDDGLQMSFMDDIDYLLGYMLDHETAGSPTLLDIERFKRPFDYQLHVTGEDGVLRKQPVDLVTTFNFLLGLAVQTIRRYEDNGRPYVRVTGSTPEGSRVCVLWRNGRSVDELDAERDWVMVNVLHDVAYDKLYVNGENVIPDALLIEDAFKQRMFEGVH